MHDFKGGYKVIRTCLSSRTVEKASEDFKAQKTIAYIILGIISP